MNHDNDLVTSVKESVTDLHLDIPFDAIQRRGRELRMRRRLASGATITAVAGGAALAATMVSSGTAPTQARLAAWTVTTRPNETVHVTIRQLDDPAGLQQALRADGIPARVAFAGAVVSTNADLPPGCTAPHIPEAENSALQRKIITGGPDRRGIALIIHKSAIRDGIGIYLTVQNGSSQSSFGWGLDLVQATARCTGS